MRECARDGKRLVTSELEHASERAADARVGLKTSRWKEGWVGGPAGAVDEEGQERGRSGEYFHTPDSRRR